MTPGKIKIEPKGLEWNTADKLKGFFQSIIHAKDGDTGSAIVALIGALLPTTPVEGIAYSFILKALEKAVGKIIKSNRSLEGVIQEEKEAVEKRKKLIVEFIDLLSKGRYEIDSNFFYTEAQHKLLNPAKNALKNWLKTEYLFSEAGAKETAYGLPGYFLESLVEIEKENPIYVEKIKKELHSEYTEALDKKRKKKIYQNKLLNEYINHPAFKDANVLLSDMYVAPNFYIHQECISKEKIEEAYFERITSDYSNSPYFTHKTLKKNVHSFFSSWLSGEKQLDIEGEEGKMMILLGQPGQGKTSFCLRTLFQLLKEKPYIVDNLHIIRLRNITEHAKWIDTPLDKIRSFVAKKYFKKDPPIEFEQLKNGLVVLDGLDELFMSSGLTDQQIHDFVKNLRKEITSLHEDDNLRVLITSRLNYLNFNNFNAEKILVIKLAEFNEVQQIKWLKNYETHKSPVKLTADKIKEINSGTGKQHLELQKLIDQPILLQLIAEADYELDLDTNRSKIYGDLFNTITERKWADSQLEIFEGFSKEEGKEHFRLFLQLLAFEVFKGNNEYITRKELLKNGELKDHVEFLKDEIFRQSDLDLKDLIKNLLVSFYFQEVEREKDEKTRSNDSDNYAFEFLHKSLMEYLVAEKIWNTIKEEFSGGNSLRWNKILDIIFPLFSSKIISEEIADYLRELIHNEPEELRIKIFNKLKKPLTSLLECSFIKNYIASEDTSPFEISMACFYGFWTILTALIIAPKKLVGIQNSEYNEFFIKNIKNLSIINSDNRKNFSNLLILLTRNYPKNLVLHFQNLSVAYLRGTDLRGADLRGANLRRADLSGANLRKADLSEAFLSEAFLREAFLRRAFLRRAFLRGADLSGANLSGVNLSGVNLSNAYLHEADLHEADLSRADLSNAKNLETANFSKTIYEGKFKKKDQ